MRSGGSITIVCLENFLCLWPTWHSLHSCKSHDLGNMMNSAWRNCVAETHLLHDSGTCLTIIWVVLCQVFQLGHSSKSAGALLVFHELYFLERMVHCSIVWPSKIVSCSQWAFNWVGQMIASLLLQYSESCFCNVSSFPERLVGYSHCQLNLLTDIFVLVLVQQYKKTLLHPFYSDCLFKVVTVFSKILSLN